MARVALNIAKAYDDSFIADFEKNKYFQLHKNAATHADLYRFAIAIAKMEGKEPTDIQIVNSFVRTENLDNYESLLSVLFYKLIGWMDNLYQEIKDEVSFFSINQQ